MKHIFSIVCLFLVSSFSYTYAQNVPDANNVLSGTPTFTENYPTDLDQMGTTPTKFNFTRVYTPLIPMATVPAYSPSNNNISISSTYTDGWGRPIVSFSKIWNGMSLVQPYDGRAQRTQISFIPFETTYNNPKLSNHLDIFSSQKQYYSNAYSAEGETAYSKGKSYSNQGVPTSVAYAPGKEFTGEERGVTSEFYVGSMSQLTNVTDLATIYKLEYDAGNNTICRNGSYTTSEYVATWVKGQHNSEILQYTDKRGKLLCKKEKKDAGVYLTTYYVYNDLGQLIFILPPKESDEVITNSCLNDVIPSSGPAQVFAYTYNALGQNTTTQTPGKEGIDRVVYDRYHRVVLSQSPKMALDGKAYFTLYDKVGRAVMTGLFTENNNMDQAYYNSLVDGTTSLPTYTDPQTSQPVPQENTLEYWLLNDMPINDYPQDQNGEPYLAECEIHTLNYYDNYDADPANAVSFVDYPNDYLTTGGAEEPEFYEVVQGHLVATKTRILDNGITHNWGSREWITTVFFYDEKGRVIQSQAQNPWSTDWDIATNQYNFIGQTVLSITEHHHLPNSRPNAMAGTSKILTKYSYSSHDGSIQSTEQSIDGSVWHSIDNTLYNFRGQVKTHQLGGVENQEFDYNISGQVTGINKNLLHSPASTLTSAFVSYASELNYETGFSDSRYDGKLTGYKWRTKGSSDAMAYGYDYDDLGRMTNAAYRYLDPGTSPATNSNWITTDLDYTVSNLDYDDNGNILSMNQKGDQPLGVPSPGPVTIDELSYTYDATGTRLTAVSDNIAAGTSSADIHDFEENSGALPGGQNNPFEYDVNGNLTKDHNRKITDMSYTFQDLPESIVKGADGDVKYIYDADGSLLQKTITDNNTATVTTYHYWGPFVYKDEVLEMVMHEQGRARYDVGNDEFDYDFFVRDHLTNVRTIVESQLSYGTLDYHAGFEQVAAPVETAIFDQIGEVRDLKPQGLPGDMESGILNGGVPGEEIGAALLVHAMAGEQFNLKGYGYYEEEDPQVYNMYSYPEDMLTSLTNALTGTAAEGEGGSNPVQTINNLMTGTNYNLYEGLKQANTNSNYPRAYLNYLVFDESFNLQTQHSHVVQISGAPNNWHLMQVPGNQTMPVSGYLLVYFSNESVMDVAVDNMHIINYQQQMLEDQHYYPHGMVIENTTQSIQPGNNYLAQSNELNKELGLYINNFNARRYDAQLGRFMGIDPLADYAGQEGLNPYQFCFNDPGNYIDPLGLNGMKRGGGIPCGDGPGEKRIRTGSMFGWLVNIFDNISLGGDASNTIFSGSSEASIAGSAGLMLDGMVHNYGGGGGGMYIHPSIESIIQGYWDRFENAADAVSKSGRYIYGVNGSASVLNTNFGHSDGGNIFYGDGDEDESTLYERLKRKALTWIGEKWDEKQSEFYDYLWKHFWEDNGFDAAFNAILEVELGMNPGYIKNPKNIVKDAKKYEQIVEAANSAKKWLGPGYKKVTNKAGDLILMSKDGLRKIRFDLKNSHGDKPHVHLEIFKNGKWRDALKDQHRIYPK